MKLFENAKINDKVAHWDDNLKRCYGTSFIQSITETHIYTNYQFTTKGFDKNGIGLDQTRIFPINTELFDSINSNLRNDACKHPQLAFFYALLWDQAPHPQTRSAAAQNDHWAFHYALEIDKKPTTQTKTTKYKILYSTYVLALSKNPIDRLKSKLYKLFYNPDPIITYSSIQRKYHENYKY